MSGAESFFDTNILLYLLSGESDKADRAEVVLVKGGIISVQVLNEFAAVASRKLGTVSYTHLDVYKRQRPDSSLSETTSSCSRGPDAPVDS